MKRVMPRGLHAEQTEDRSVTKLLRPRDIDVPDVARLLAGHRHVLTCDLDRIGNGTGLVLRNRRLLRGGHSLPHRGISLLTRGCDRLCCPRGGQPRPSGPLKGNKRREDRHDRTYR